MKDKKAFVRGAVMGFLMMVPMVAVAADDASTILSTTHTTLLSLATQIVNVVSIVMGLVGVVMLGINLAKYLKGDPSSNDALMKVGGGPRPQARPSLPRHSPSGCAPPSRRRTGRCSPAKRPLRPPGSRPSSLRTTPRPSRRDRPCPIPQPAFPAAIPHGRQTACRT